MHILFYRRDAGVASRRSDRRAASASECFDSRFTHSSFRHDAHTTRRALRGSEEVRLMGHHDYMSHDTMPHDVLKKFRRRSELCRIFLPAARLLNYA